MCGKEVMDNEGKGEGVRERGVGWGRAALIKGRRRLGLLEPLALAADLLAAVQRHACQVASKASLASS